MDPPKSDSLIGNQEADREAASNMRGENEVKGEIKGKRGEKGRGKGNEEGKRNGEEEKEGAVEGGSKVRGGERPSRENKEARTATDTADGPRDPSDGGQRKGKNNSKGASSRSKSSVASESNSTASDSNNKVRPDIESSDEGIDGLTCTICMEPLTSYVISQCLHKSSCGNCFLVNKIHYDRDTCSICFNKLEGVAVITRKSKGGKGDLTYSAKLNCHFDDRSYMRELEDKLKFTCSECKISVRNISALKAHAKEAHSKEYCNICLNKRKVFSFEQRLYSAKDMENHRTKGDPAVGFEGPLPAHIKCKVCREWCYDRDDLVKHTLLAHCCCHLCKRKGTEVWLLDNNALIGHYHSAHLTCDHPDCSEIPLENVFEDELSLQAHILKVHNKCASKKDKKVIAQISLPSPSSAAELYPSLDRSAGPSSGGRRQGGARELTSPSLREASRSAPVVGKAEGRELTRLLEEALNPRQLDIFREECSLFLQRIIDPSTFYDMFTTTFNKSQEKALIWMELVGSLPDFELRTKLHEIHFKSVKSGRYFSANRSEADLLNSDSAAMSSTTRGDIQPNTSSNSTANSSALVEGPIGGGGRISSNAGRDIGGGTAIDYVSRTSSSTSANSIQSSSISNIVTNAPASSLKSAPKVPPKASAWTNAATNKILDNEESGVPLALAQPAPVNSFWNLNAKSAVKDKDAKKQSDNLADLFPSNSAVSTSNQATGSQKKFGKGKKVTVIAWG